MANKKPESPTAHEWELQKAKNGLTDADREEWEESLKKSVYIPKIAGLTLRYERMRSGLTQEEAAGSIGISAASLARWERGTHDISLENAYKLIMLYRRFPGDRENFEKAHLDIICGISMC